MLYPASSTFVSTPTLSSFTQSSPHTIPETEFPVVRVIYDFTPTSPFELAVHGQSYLCFEPCCCSLPPGYPLTCLILEGATVRVIEEDDGSGWVKVLDEGGGRGLVPASYVESADASRAPESGAGRPIGSGQFGK